MSRNATSFIVDKMEHPGRPGAIMFLYSETKRPVGFSHACPCGCGKWSFIRLDPEAWVPGTTPIWTRTGDDLHMTMSPSIGIRPKDASGAYHWHGFLRDGVFGESRQS